jgi:pimeloyl-ACP methyl ester carboxylesterase
MFAERYWRSRDGLDLYMRDYPAASGPARLPVICLHGLTRTARDFEDVAPWLATQGRSVLVPDIRGRGRSGRDPDAMNYQVRTYARDILEMMDTIGMRRAVFLGTSMGGLITMAAAALRSEAVAAAILNDVGPEISPVGLKRIAGYAGKAVELRTWEDAVARVRQTMGDAFPDYQERDWQAFARRTFREGPDGAPQLDYDLDIAKPIMAGRVRTSSWIAWFMFRRLARRRPTLLVRGSISDLITAEIAGRMQKAAPTLRIVEVARIGHAPMLTEPAATEGISCFLDMVA